MKRRARPVKRNKQELAVVPEEEETLMRSNSSTSTSGGTYRAEFCASYRERSEPAEPNRTRSLKTNPDDNNTAAGTSAGHERDR